jgi:hypothetical protein
MYEATMRAVRRHIWWAGLGAALLSGCGGGGSDDPVAREDAQSRPSYSVGGTITGVVSPPFGGSILLYLDGAYVEPFDATKGTFTFNKQLFRGDTYNVSVAGTVTGYTCGVTSGASGTIERSNVTDVVVSCVENPRYDVSVSVSGLKSGNSVVIQNLGAANQVTATADGTYLFPFKQYDNTNYFVTIVSETTRANCTVPQPFGVFTAGMSPIEVQCGVK